MVEVPIIHLCRRIKKEVKYPKKRQGSQPKIEIENKILIICEAMRLGGISKKLTVSRNRSPKTKLWGAQDDVVGR